MTGTSIDSNEDDLVVLDCDDVSNYNPEQILPQPAEEIKNIRKWLRPTDYAQEGGEFRKHLQSHMPGTGDWLMSSDSFQTWLSSDNHGLLWIKGIPGSGKSVFASHIIEFLKHSNPGCPRLYFFFRQIIDANHEPAALLRDWLDQVLDYSPPLQKELMEIAQSRRSVASLSMEDLWSYLRLALRSLPDKVFCVADALDEMDGNNDEFLRSLAALGRWKPHKIKVLFTSRPVSSIEEPLRKIKMLQTRLEEQMVDSDISRYVERGLRASPHISIDEQDQIREAVPGRANGIFLYAKLAMEAFLKPDAKVDEVLRTLPQDLNELYASLLHEHSVRSGVPHEIQLLILQWVTHATRPLRLIEIAEMISVTYQPADGSETRRDLASTKMLVRAAAGPLLEILPNETVCVIHHSFTEYLKCMTRSESDEGYPVLRFASTHARLALACLTYLRAGCLDSLQMAHIADNSNTEDEQSNSDDYEDENDYKTREKLYSSMSSGYNRLNEEENRPELQRIQLQYPFFAYARSNWNVHVARCSASDFVQDEVNAALARFLGDEKYMKAWLKHNWAHSKIGIKGVTALHIAARYGLTFFAECLILQGADVNAKDIYGKTPIWWAASSGHANIIRLIIQAGGDPNVPDRVVGLKPLHEAASHNHAEAVRALLEAGVDPLTTKTLEHPGRRCGNAPRSVGHTPLMYTCQHGHLEALEAFLPFLKNIDTVHRALAWSAENKRSKLVKRILQHDDVDVNAKIRGNTALYLACRNLDYETIMTLLRAGADPKIVCLNSGEEFRGMHGRRRWNRKMVDDSRGYRALHALCQHAGGRYRNHDDEEPEKLFEIFRLLLAKGGSVNHRTPDGETALHAAVNNPFLVKLIISAGADVDAEDDRGIVALHNVRSVEALCLFVEEGHASIDHVNPKDGRTPLLTMLGGSSTDVIKKLLEYRPKLSIKDKDGNGPLHLALRTWAEDTTIVKSLLDAGADPNERNLRGDTPLLAANMTHRNTIPFFDLLLEAGADIEAKDTSGMTLLSRIICSTSGTDESNANAKALLARGAKIDCRDNKGRTLLHQAVGTYHYATFGNKKSVSRFEFLLGLGLSPKLLDYRGNTLLHESVLRSNSIPSLSSTARIELIERLLELGVDLDLGNHQGRTFLHIIAATDPCGSSSLANSTCSGFFEFVLSKVKDIDQRDVQGLTALHLASTVSEHATKKLLDAGANLRITSNDGLSPLHLAARARHSNIVGMLLASAKDSTGPFVNLEDVKGRTALYYACQSGRYETVALLLQAGALSTDKIYFDACGLFEEEQLLWTVDRHPADTERNQSASCLTIDDTSRPVKPTGSFNYRGHDLNRWVDQPRLEEIIDLLVAHQCDTATLFQGNQQVRSCTLARTSASNYTWRCLLRAQEAAIRLLGEEFIPNERLDFRVRLVKTVGDAYIDALETMETTQVQHWQSYAARHALTDRQFQVMTTLFDKGVDFLSGTGLCHSGCHYHTLIEAFVAHGYPFLLEEIGNLEAERQRGKGIWHAFGDANAPGLYKKNSPEEVVEHGGYHKQKILLRTALERELPNMEVVRLLVETFHVDINQHRYDSQNDGGKARGISSGTALHYLAGGRHWWHVALAMPYLISKGAALEARDWNGRTPLHIALENWAGTFGTDAVRTLITAGADVNASSNEASCLAISVRNPNIAELLLAHGATIDAGTLMTAVKGQEMETLKMLLKAGADPNMREEQETPNSRGLHTKTHTPHSDLPECKHHPLYLVSNSYGKQSRPDQSKAEVTAELMRLLLSAGADPFAVFTRVNANHSKSKEDEEPAVTELFMKVTDTEKYESIPILHALLADDELAHPILSLGSLDPNRRDRKGRTIAHLICKNHSLYEPMDSSKTSDKGVCDPSMPSFMDRLQQLGADLLATDHHKRNALHYLFVNNKYCQSEDENLANLKRLVEEYPSLLNQADDQGYTPLHMSLKQGVFTGKFEAACALLGAGADAFAVDMYGNTCLHIVAFAIYMSVNARTMFTDLLNRGLDINAKNKRGETPIFNLNRWCGVSFYHRFPQEKLIWAAEALSFFEKAGADLFVKNNSGKGLLHIAAKETREPLINHWSSSNLFGVSKVEFEPSIARFKILLQKGLDPKMEDDQRRTALDVAAACGKESVMKLFEKDGLGVTQTDLAEGNGFESDSDL